MTSAGLAGCAAQPEMGRPLTPDRGAVGAPAPRPTAPAQHTKERENWDQVWREIDADPTRVDWITHYQACTIQFRYRRYDALFRCADSFDHRVQMMAAGQADADSLKRYAPVLTGWLRASAYAELGSPEVALQWAASSWDALPDYFRTATQSGDQRRGYEFSTLCDRVTGVTRLTRFMPSAVRAQDTRYNPAALDLSAASIAMNLAAERATALATLGRSTEARAALDVLREWQTATVFEPKMAFVFVYSLHDTPFKVRAELLTIGPLFALHDYSGVVAAYRAAEQDTGGFRVGDAMQKSGLGGLQLLDKMTDHRAFATALEDVSYALIYAESLSRLDQREDARAMLDTILKFPEIRDMGSLYWVALYERGSLALKDGDRARATEWLQQSVEAIERTRSTISVEAAKIGYAGDKERVYATLVGLYAQNQQWDAALLVAERAKARALVDLLAQQRSLAPPSGSDERVRTLLASATSTDSTFGLPGDTDVERNLQSAADSRTALAAAAPEAASLVSVQSPSIDQIAARLEAGDTLIDYYRTGDTLYALVLVGHATRGYELNAQGLDEEVRAFRAAIERGDSDVQPRGQALYDRLIRPFEDELMGSELTISPHGILHYLPFAALTNGNGYLIDRFSIRMTPSAGALVYLRREAPNKVGQVLALGNPDLGDPKLNLPNAELEAEHVAALFPASKALVRAEASKTAVKNLGSGFSVLHFATHGTFDDAAPLASGLYLAKGDEPDGLLTVTDLYQMRLDANLVTLSACQTALGKVANGDDVIGLTRGFLYAGARTIVASLWKVNDAATEHLMISFYTNLRDHTSRDALRLAQIETRASYPSPVYWAAFQIMGSAD